MSRKEYWQTWINHPGNREHHRPSFQEDFHRFEVLRDLGCLPFIMPYNNGGGSEQRKFVKWVNKLYYQVVPWEEFDPFIGSGTTILVAQQLNRSCTGIELSMKYCQTLIIPRCFTGQSLGVDEYLFENMAGGLEQDSNSQNPQKGENKK